MRSTISCSPAALDGLATLIVGQLALATELHTVRRALIERHLPAPSREKEAWRYVANELRQVALGRNTAEFVSASADGAVAGGHRMAGEMTPRRFPPPWSIEETR